MDTTETQEVAFADLLRRLNNATIELAEVRGELADLTGRIASLEAKGRLCDSWHEWLERASSQMLVAPFSFMKDEPARPAPGIARRGRRR